MITGQHTSVYFWNVTAPSSPFQIRALASILISSYRPTFSCMVYSNTIYMSTQKGVVVSIGPDTAAGCELNAYINSANSNAVYAIANLGTK